MKTVLKVVPQFARNKQITKVKIKKQKLMWSKMLLNKMKMLLMTQSKMMINR